MDRNQVETVAAMTGHKMTDEDVRWAQSLDAAVSKVFGCAGGATATAVLTRQECADLVTYWRSQAAHP